MTQFERQVRTAQHRLWLNRWFHAATGLLAAAAAVFAVVVLVQRLYDLPMPLLWIGVGLGVVVLVGSIWWTATGRASRATAAATLDEAAGLRERLSSGQYCVSADDPFARAVVADAERTAGSLSARQHIRFTMPRPFGWSIISVALSALMCLGSPGLL